MYISNPDLMTSLLENNLNQNSSNKIELNDGLSNGLNVFEQFLKDELLHSGDPLAASSVSPILSNQEGTTNNIFSANNTILANMLFNNIITQALLQGETSAQSVEDKTRVAQIYSKSQPIDSSPSSGKYEQTFNNDVFLGDSITKGLSAYRLLDDSKVYAQVGIGTDKVKQMVDSAAKENPKRVFIMCGVNDVGKYTKAQFSKHYTDLINTVKAECPNAQIYVQAILPVQSKATQKNPALNNTAINEFNSAIFQIAQTEHVGFINPSALVNYNPSYYAADGIHYTPSFYTSWLNFLQKNAV
ncbi:lysophospholipase L1-like esterase [Desulfosporosinus acidiphilus SJ4]|uniref:Lysophospholipase L1-like esterase n=1 Tax=Desulfosporosinus acidiphilus (strain DSM 22704 / JCM 16185 / SJ4) TaxID=646529 RepID=I4D109_DESAJ|nr:GDSL-type esterase/lipase family protein [Desulfosporosinus acidiphilus]AFM39483.1 lysophospholipase L1-like esterase [Desulfosporosinus acidiphilus SJ4]